MKTVTINNFSGGIAEDLREEKTNTFSYVSGFDIFSNPHKLSPYRTTETETVSSGTLTDFKMTDVCLMLCSIGGTPTTNIYSLGQAGVADTNAKFFEKSSVNDISASFSATTNGEDTANNVVGNTLVAYKSKLYALKTDNTNSFLVEYDRSTTTLAIKADGGASTTLNGVALAGVKPFRHPKDDILYIAHGYTISKLDNTTLTRNVLALPTDLNITSLTDYGNYLAIATAPVVGGVPSKVYLWDRNSSLATVSEVIDFGDGSLKVLDNIDGSLVGVMSNQVPSGLPAGGLNANTNTQLLVKVYNGGVPVLVKKIKTGSSYTLYNYKAKYANRLLFAAQGTINGNTSPYQIWSVGKNANGTFSVSLDMLPKSSTGDITALTGFNVIGDFVWVGFNDTTDGRFYRTVYSSATYPTCTYESLINPNMPVEERTKRKKLVSVSVAKATTTGTLTVYYKVDGGAYATIGTLSASGSLVLKATNESTGKPFEEGYEYQFKVESATGAEFTELKYSYEMVNELL